jgi:uncharacterized membrane protein
MAEKLLLAMGGVCGLRPAHSYFAGTTQLPLEARMIGIYGSVSLTFGWLLWKRRLGATRLGTWQTISILGVLFLTMVIDGVNSTLATMGLDAWYTSTNLTRISTGLVSGIGFGAMLIWLLGLATRRPGTLPTNVVHSSMELLPLLGLNALFGFVVVAAGQIV